jgi:predicted RNase H-like HicB family nuclease
MLDKRPVKVNFSPRAFAVLEELATEQGKTLSEVLRDAIALEKYVADTRREGGRILVEREGTVRELLRI